MPFVLIILRNITILATTIGVLIFSIFQNKNQPKGFSEFENDVLHLRASIIYRHDPVTINARLYSLENSLKEIMPREVANREVGKIYQKLNENDDKSAVSLLNDLQGQVRKNLNL
ncbi:MAG: hypothetical protein ACK4NY_05320 [Spirosomataceae bacterium]